MADASKAGAGTGGSWPYEPVDPQARVHEPLYHPTRVHIELGPSSSVESIEEALGSLGVRIDQRRLAFEYGLEPDDPRMERYRGTEVFEVRDVERARQVIREIGDGTTLEREPLYWTMPSHYTYAPGADFVIPGVTHRAHVPKATSPNKDGVPVIVIDSGLVPGNAWSGALVGLTGEAELHSDEFPSHGTFVGATIAQVAEHSDVHVFSMKYAAGSTIERLLVAESQIVSAIHRVEDFLDQKLTDGSPEKGKYQTVVVNMSFGTACKTDSVDGVPQITPPPGKLPDAMEALLGRSGVKAVAAAGNDGPVGFTDGSAGPMATYPAADHRVTAVGVTDGLSDDGTWYLWPRFEEVSIRCRQIDAPPDWIDVLAPGLDLLGIVNEDTRAFWSGSSFASAIYAGLLARKLAGEVPTTTTLPNRGSSIEVVNVSAAGPVLFGPYGKTGIHKV